MPKNPTSDQPDRRIYRGLTLTRGSLPTPEDQQQHLSRMPPPPPWRTFGLSVEQWREKAKSQNTQDIVRKINPKALGFVPSKQAVELVNAALCLRRPLLMEGNPGSGKTSLAYAVAAELGLPGPYRWSIVSRTTLKDGLYAYDAIGRLQEVSLLRQQVGNTERIKEPDIGNYLRLRPMGMAFHQSQPGRPAVLLIDEIDKSDIDMPNDLLHIFEEGFFEIPELSRLNRDFQKVLPYRSHSNDSDEKISVDKGLIQCQEFPLVLMTSNEAREFPPAFLRRCLRLSLKQPDTEEGFYKILENRFDATHLKQLDEPARKLIKEFLARIKARDTKLATDQLLNAIYLLLQGDDLTEETRKEVLNTIFKSL
ncbi:MULTISPECIES: MoxR family ATPase [unclassified Moorena]|uniref:AAA family ATPase n=1 Tax=unclassified Moorena TaxID=2683338 RepID=UPI0013CC780C|nr:MULTISPECIES: MoxR family ATPase [unclassified Moorena]NEO18649.1 AAA family ATPase [Moorena sp. SIO4A5]NEP21656.1 AAA family ATPase [Moorena sp. SIO3I6]